MNDVELIEQVKVSSATTHIQPPNFSKTKDKDLLVLLATLRAVGTSCLHHLDLFPASILNFDFSHYLIVLDLHCKYAHREIVNRINKLPDCSTAKRAGNLLLEGKSEEEVFLALLENVSPHFKNPAKRIKYLHTFNMKHEEDQDLISIAQEGACKFRQNMYTAVDKELEPIFAPYPFLSMEARAWVRAFLPVLRSGWDELPGKVQQALKNHYEKYEAAKRDGAETQYDEKAGKPSRALLDEDEEMHEILDVTQFDKGGDPLGMDEQYEVLADRTADGVYEDEVSVGGDDDDEEDKELTFEERPKKQTGKEVDRVLQWIQEPRPSRKTPLLTRPAVRTNKYQEIVGYGLKGCPSYHLIAGIYYRDKELRHEQIHQGGRIKITISPITAKAWRRRLGGQHKFAVWMREHARDCTINISGSPITPPPIQYSDRGSRGAAQIIIEDWHLEEQIEEEQKTLDNLESRLERTLRELETQLGPIIGPKARRAFEMRSKVNTDQEAAKLTGISERTFRYYKTELQKIDTALADKED